MKRSKHAQRKIDARTKDRTLDPYLDDQFTTGRLFACISSRPGQCGRADGWVPTQACCLRCRPLLPECHEAWAVPAGAG